ncbi:MAG TPA: hypothetical protein VMZ91_11160 [Candidatus Paceibacterota bacterium]|nr:hypothetical protein [Candidatus Paceibacterota bacterium]
MNAKKYTIVDLVEANHKRISSTKKQLELLRKNIDKIRNNVNTKKINYPTFKECYEYVDNLFPRANVKRVTLYKPSPLLMQKLGFGHAGGFYDRISKIVVFTRSRSPVGPRDKYAIKAKLNQDEVIVHELCHYSYFEEGKSSVSQELNEEFAYGWSIGYLRQKGYSDEDIVEKNFLPYLYNNYRNPIAFSVLARHGISKDDYGSFSKWKKNSTYMKHRSQIHKETLSFATQEGLKLVNIYSKKLNGEDSGKTVDKGSNFSFLDFDD